MREAGPGCRMIGSEHRAWWARSCEKGLSPHLDSCRPGLEGGAAPLIHLGRGGDW